MCGVTGIYSESVKVNLEELEIMTKSLEHRGPDDFGFWRNKNQNICLGHRRLAILDLSEKGKQPMSYCEDRFQITYNGEIYNFIELRDDLKKRGFSFKTQTDTEVLLALYQLHGDRMLSFLDGMFAFAIWDNIERTLFCARDRFGEKPFYFYEQNEVFYFASEIKAFWSIGLNKRIDYSKVYSYLIFGGIRDFEKLDETFFKDVNSLKPGHYIHLKKGSKIHQEEYWSLDAIHPRDDISFDFAQEKFIGLFQDSIRKRLRSDVAVGSSLSGGLDSSSIVHFIKNLKTKNGGQYSFSARFPNYKNDEGPIIDKFLSSNKEITKFFVFPSIETVSSKFESLIRCQDEPFGSLSIAAQFEVMEKARNENIPVLLDGQAADEILGGYSKFYQTYLAELKANNKDAYREELRIILSVDPNFTFKKNSMLSGDKWIKIKAQIRKQIGLINPTNNYFNGVHPELVKENRSTRPTERIFENSKDLMKYSLVKRDIPELLRYADRNSMAHSIEVRLPFLSHELVQFAFQLPAKYFFKNAWTKFILRSYMDKRLPDEITWNRKKIGFEPPQDKWLNSPFFREKISDAKEFLKKEKIIIETKDELNWKYIMLHAYLSK